MLKQEYNNYTPEDQLVWKTLFERQMNNLANTASKQYLKGIKDIQFKADKIPDFKEMDVLLRGQTRWSVHVVPGLIPQKEFFQLLVQRKFSASTWLRKLTQLDYLEEPDMFHDVFGHVPLLTNQNFCDFFEGISTIAVESINHPEIIEMLGRLYWFTIEFGLITENNQLKIYGAGIASSASETKFCLSNTPKHIAYDATKIMNTPFFTDRIQDTYFVIESFKQLYDSLEEIKNVCDEKKN